MFSRQLTRRFGERLAFTMGDGYCTPRLIAKEETPVLFWAGVAVVVLAVACRFAAQTGGAHRGPLDHLDRHGEAGTAGSPGALVHGQPGAARGLDRADSAQTDATVVRIRVLPGAKVTPDTVIMDLADPQLEQELLNAQLGLKAAQADYKSLQATLQSTLMDKKTAAAQVNADYTQDQLQAQTDKALYDLGVISGLAYQKSKSTADQLTAQHQLSQQQLDVNQKAIEVQLASQKTKIDQAKALLDLYQQQARRLRFRPGSPARWRRWPLRCRWANTSPREPRWPK